MNFFIAKKNGCDGCCYTHHETVSTVIFGAVVVEELKVGDGIIAIGRYVLFYVFPFSTQEVPGNSLYAQIDL